MNKDVLADKVGFDTAEKGPSCGFRTVRSRRFESSRFDTTFETIRRTFKTYVQQNLQNFKQYVVYLKDCRDFGNTDWSTRPDGQAEVPLYPDVYKQPSAQLPAAFDFDRDLFWAFGGENWVGPTWDVLNGADDAAVITDPGSTDTGSRSSRVAVAVTAVGAVAVLALAGRVVRNSPSTAPEDAEAADVNEVLRFFFRALPALTRKG